MKATHQKLLMCAVALTLSSAAHAGGDKGKTMDADNDGRVSSSEHAAGATAMFAETDADGNGSVTASEMDAHWKAMGNGAKEGGMSSADKIKAIDTDGDGALSSAEHSAGSQAKFAEMDANRDGSLDKAEMDAGHKGMKK